MQDLLIQKKEKVHRISLLEFIRYGLHYVFPAVPRSIVNGIPTAHSHPFMKSQFISPEPFVWPELEGRNRGQAIEPLYKEMVKAAKSGSLFYLLLALVDTIRVGKTREIKVALAELQKIFENESPTNEQFVDGPLRCL